MYLTSEGKCLKPARTTGVDDYLTISQCKEIANLGYGNGEYYCRHEKDYWAWAVKECGGVNNMASLEDLAEIASKIYDTNISRFDNPTNLIYNSTIASSLGLNLPSSEFVIWGGCEGYSDRGCSRYFKSSSSGYGYSNRNAKSPLFICKTD